jgi:hypothetical protein
MTHTREPAESDSVVSAALTELRQLETRVDALIEAVEVLARGLEIGPLDAPDDFKPGEAARRARELLLLAKSGQRAG